ncbi:pre-mRNA-splicing regulator wtap-like [Plakobranchus ocellatus]|uniref:Pre-mRNA-splicing regulator wtap-like n=1 Tax=Plakobranchus ocellatus TaxID=259542 RepID=A0AAV3ZUM6_9GAST|nr:pre-mRNA-splicing regulator wtap-like [Plakobranchus ocellatus]
MSETSLSPKRPRLDFDDSASKDEHSEKYRSRDREREQDDQSSYSNSHSKHKKRLEPVEDDEGKDEDCKAKLSGAETARREHTLVMRLANKEQELQECMNQIQEMKQAQTQNTAQLRSMLLDPAINLVFQRMAKEMDDHKDKLKQKQNELTAWKFTPDSQTGMRVMARCRMLLQENQELGKMISSGRTARLEGEIVLHKALATEMKKNQKELDEFVGELEEDVDGMQGMILLLRQQLKEAQEQIARLQTENEQLRTLRIPPEPEPGGSSLANSSATTPTHSWSDAEQNSGVAPGTSVHSVAQDTTSKASAQKHTSLANSSTVFKVEADAAGSLSAGVETNHDHLLSSTHPFDEFNSGLFASKVTPDSGVLTQEEEEETSVDAPDFTSAARLHDSKQIPQSCDQLDIFQNTTDKKTSSKENTSSDLEIAPQVSLPESLSGKTTPPPMLNEVSQGTQSPDIKSKVFVENDHVRTTSLSTSIATHSSIDTNSTNCSSHSLHPGSTQKSETRTKEMAESQTAINFSVEGGTFIQESNNAIARTKESLPLSSDEVVTTEQTVNQQGTGETENKSELHQSLGLGTDSKVEDDKMECPSSLGLVNGSAKAHN